MELWPYDLGATFWISFSNVANFEYLEGHPSSDVVSNLHLEERCPT